jgi:hypothetical protein
MKLASFGTFFALHDICITCTTKMMLRRFDVRRTELIDPGALPGSERRVTQAS